MRWSQLCASTTSPRFDVEVHRWGATRELVWSARGIAGREQPTPPDADAAGCGWEPLVEIPTERSWQSGFYLVTMTAHDAPADRAVGYAGFVVRALARGRVLLVLATNTWNAYNNWGGRSLYTGGKEVSFRRPWGRGMLVRPDVDREDRKSPPRRPGEEPDIDGDMYQKFRYEHGFPGYMGSAGWFTYDRRFAEWAERAGFALDYAISSDLEQVDGVTDGYRLVIGAGHDEYWSAAGRDTIERFVAAGGNYASFSGNTMFWRVRLERDGTSMVCHKYSAHETDPIVTDDPSAVTGMWSDPVAGRTERGLLGAASMYGLYARFGQATPRGVPGFVVYRPDHWLLDGTGLRYGDVLGADDGVVGYETVGTKIALDDVQPPGRRDRPGRCSRQAARRRRDRRPHTREQSGDGRVSGLDRSARRPGRPRVRRGADLRRWRGSTGEGAQRQRRDADVPPVRHRRRAGVDGREHGLGVRSDTRCRCATRHEQRSYPVVRMTRQALSSAYNTVIRMYTLWNCGFMSENCQVALIDRRKMCPDGHRTSGNSKGRTS